MRRGSLLPTLVLAAGTWLAAGPGGVTLRAIAACRHHAAAHASHAGHHTELPPGTPCWCDEMTGGGDALLAPAHPAPTVVAPITAAAVSEFPFPFPPSPFPGFVRGPIPPPPNPLA